MPQSHTTKHFAFFHPGRRSFIYEVESATYFSQLAFGSSIPISFYHLGGKNRFLNNIFKGKKEFLSFGQSLILSLTTSTKVFLKGSPNGISTPTI